jgi:hypothetical protein
VAAAEALGHLADAFPHHSVEDLAAAAGVAPPERDVAFEGLDLQRVLDKDAPLLCSGGQVCVVCVAANGGGERRRRCVCVRANAPHPHTPTKSHRSTT